MGNTTRCGCTNRVLVVLLHDSPLLLEAVPDSGGVGVYQPVGGAAFSLWIAPDWSWLVCWWV